MRLPFESGAADELEAAAIRYEEERFGFGTLLISEVRRSVDRAARFPESGVQVFGFDPKHEVRRFVLRRFPYSVVIAIVAGQRVVVAVAHSSRNPDDWRHRVK